MLAGGGGGGGGALAQPRRGEAGRAASGGGEQRGWSGLKGGGDQLVQLSGGRTDLLEQTCICQVSVSCTPLRMHRDCARRRESLGGDGRR